MRIVRKFQVSIVALALLLSMPIFADVETFEDHGEWTERASDFFTIDVIDFEDIVVPEEVRFIDIDGTEFEGMPGSPVLSSISEPEFGIATSQGSEISPVSGSQFFISFNPTLPRDPCCGNVVSIQFSEPIVAFGAWFLDVETGFESTGFDLDNDGTPEVHFTHRNFARGFLGLVTDEPISSLNIHFSTGTPNDGIALDDLSYVLDRTSFIRGDANSDGQIDISDPVSVLIHLFLVIDAKSSACADALDANDSGRVDISDAIGVLAHLFSGGFPPASPFPDCGIDVSDDLLRCESFGSCK